MSALPDITPAAESSASIQETAINDRRIRPYWAQQPA